MIDLNFLLKNHFRVISGKNRKEIWFLIKKTDTLQINYQIVNNYKKRLFQ